MKTLKESRINRHAERAAEADQYNGASFEDVQKWFRKLEADRLRRIRAAIRKNK